MSTVERPVAPDDRVEGPTTWWDTAHCNPKITHRERTFLTDPALIERGSMGGWKTLWFPGPCDDRQRGWVTQTIPTQGAQNEH